MKIKAVHIFLMVLASFHCVLDAHAQERLNTNQEAKQILESAKQAIDRFPSGAQPAKNVIRIVSFHPSDRRPSAGWRERLVRTLVNVRDFYQDGLRRLGRRRIPVSTGRERSKSCFASC